jgi:hypothetical protein
MERRKKDAFVEEHLGEYKSIPTFTIISCRRGFPFT